MARVSEMISVGEAEITGGGRTPSVSERAGSVRRGESVADNNGEYGIRMNPLLMV
jgi:hypothetical protein